MEYCDGGSVYDVMNECNIKLSEEEIAAACASVVKGLCYLHGSKHIHRVIGICLQA